MVNHATKSLQKSYILNKFKNYLIGGCFSVFIIKLHINIDKYIINIVKQHLLHVYLTVKRKIYNKTNL